MNIEELIPVAIAVSNGYKSYRSIDAKSLALMGLIVAVNRLQDDPGGHPEPIAYIRAVCHSYIRNGIRTERQYQEHCKRYGKSQASEPTEARNYSLEELIRWLDLSNDEQAILMLRLEGKSIKNIATTLRHGSHFVSTTLSAIAQRVRSL